MGSISVLDCTLRDGGYVNNWSFGQEAICGVIGGLEESGVNILELGCRGFTNRIRAEQVVHSPFVVL